MLWDACVQASIMLKTAQTGARPQASVACNAEGLAEHPHQLLDTMQSAVRRPCQIVQQSKSPSAQGITGRASSVPDTAPTRP